LILSLDSVSKNLDDGNGRNVVQRVIACSHAKAILLSRQLSAVLPQGIEQLVVSDEASNPGTLHATLPRSSQMPLPTRDNPVQNQRPYNVHQHEGSSQRPRVAVLLTTDNPDTPSAMPLTHPKSTLAQFVMHVISVLVSAGSAEHVRRSQKGSQSPELVPGCICMPPPQLIELIRQTRGVPDLLHATTSDLLVCALHPHTIGREKRASL